MTTVTDLVSHRPAPPVARATLVVGGTEDAVFPASDQRVLAAAIPGARVELVEGVGHALHWEAPGQFVEMLQPMLPHQ